MPTTILSFPTVVHSSPTRSNVSAIVILWTFHFVAVPTP